MDGDGSGYPLFIAHDSAAAKRIELGGSSWFDFSAGEGHGRRSKNRRRTAGRVGFLGRAEGTTEAAAAAAAETTPP